MSVKKWNKRTCFVVSLLLLTSLLLAACGQGGTQPSESSGTNESGAESPASGNESSSGASVEPFDFVLMAGVTGGTFWPLAVKMNEIFQLNIDEIRSTTEVPGGLAAPPEAIAAGNIHMGFSTADAVYNAYAGNPPYSKPIQDMSVFFNFFKNRLQIAVPADSGIQTLEDLKGKRLNLGIKGTTTDVIARQVLELSGFTEKDMANVQNLGFQDAVEQIKNNQMDAFLVTAQSPFPYILDIALTEKIRLIPISEEVAQKMHELNPAIEPVVIPAGTYDDVDYDVMTVQTPFSVVVANDLPEETVYKMVKLMVENQAAFGEILPDIKNLTHEDFFVDYGVPYHPGVQRYLNEQK